MIQKYIRQMGKRSQPAHTHFPSFQQILSGVIVLVSSLACVGLAKLGPLPLWVPLLLCIVPAGASFILAQRDMQHEQSPAQQNMQHEQSPAQQNTRREQSPTQQNTRREQSPAQQNTRREQSPAQQNTRREQGDSLAIFVAVCQAVLAGERMARVPLEAIGHNEEAQE